MTSSFNTSLEIATNKWILLQRIYFALDHFYCIFICKKHLNYFYDLRSSKSQYVGNLSIGFLSI